MGGNKSKAGNWVGVERRGESEMHLQMYVQGRVDLMYKSVFFSTVFWLSKL